MRIIFQSILSIGLAIASHQRATGQVLFKSPVNQSVKWGQNDTLSREEPALSSRKKTFQVTYMGSSIQPALSATDQLTDPFSQPLKKPSAQHTALRRDSLFMLLLEDSLRRVQTELRAYVAPLRADPLKHLLRTVPSILPIRIHSWSEYRISSGFGLRYHPVKGSLHNHAGIDLPQPKFSPVFATADGIVDEIVWQPEGLGLAVYIKHLSGYKTVYGHLEDHTILVGESVNRGQLIGHIGQTGMTTGPHLHYSVLVGSQPVDPTEFCFLLMKALKPDLNPVSKISTTMPLKRLGSRNRTVAATQKPVVLPTRQAPFPSSMNPLHPLSIRIKSPVLGLINRPVNLGN